MSMLSANLRAELMALAGASAHAASSALNAVALADAGAAASAFHATPQQDVTVPTFGAKIGTSLAIEVVGTSEGIQVSRSSVQGAISPDQTGVSGDGKRLSLGIELGQGQVKIVGLNSLFVPHGGDQLMASRCWIDESNSAAAMLSLSPSIDEVNALKPEQLMSF